MTQTTTPQPPLPDWLKHSHAPPPDAPVDLFTDWLRYQLRGYATNLAGLELAGELDANEGEAEILLAAIGLARHIGASREIAIIAARTAWKEAHDKAAGFFQQLHRQIIPLGREQAPGAQIIAAAERLNDRHGCILPPAILHQVTGRIARSAAPKQGTRRRHGRH